ncbi:MAG TPA: hypothetical protein PK052_12320 [Anaerohalosphaeraceae bacterium]|nr:hypothetical protein [Anaerohalosphaeraceae bacterium]HOL32753.1 hypothetical protein [Anaerohalosphaeraceae bacterium]HPO71046.1 hypothetical protein [Anaerohalosphaeraceae bacterium]
MSTKMHPFWRSLGLVVRTVGLWALLCTSASISLAGYIDGYITAGEYESWVTWSSNTQPLVVDGGGAAVIEMRNYSQLEVRSTSIPDNGNWHTGGIRDIWLDDYSRLLYTGGITDLITLEKHATAILKGGCINTITCYQLSSPKHIDIYALPGWSWISGDPSLGIQGKWWSGSPFSIEFDNNAGFAPVWTNINVIIPEPATLIALSLGSLLICKR